MVQSVICCKWSVLTNKPTLSVVGVVFPYLWSSIKCNGETAPKACGPRLAGRSLSFDDERPEPSDGFVVILAVFFLIQGVMTVSRLQC